MLSLGVRAFQYCSGLTSITIGNSVTIIKDYAFEGCTALASITIPNAVTSIGTKAFNGCSSMLSATLGKSVTDIRPSAFYECTSLASVTIPNSVTNIGSFAFAECSGLLNMYCYAEKIPLTESLAFSNSNIANATLHVPAESVSAYQVAYQWKDFKEIVALSGSEMLKCATPTITIVAGKLTFSCSTEGVSFNACYSYNSGNKTGNELILSGTTTAHVSVYATKEGYEDSDVAETDVELYVGKKGDVNADGEVTVTDAVEVVNIILGK